MALAADEVLQLGVHVVELVAEFAEDFDEGVIPFAGESFGSGHVESTTGPDLKSQAHDAFGENGLRSLDTFAPVTIMARGMEHGSHDHKVVRLLHFETTR